MPRAVQVDLVMQLQYLSTTANTGSAVIRRIALYDLAMCHMTGFGNETADVDKALNLLLEAAQLGSPKALSIVFRLHLALRGVVPELPWVGNSSIHPILEVEKRLASLPPQKYFAERVRHFEKVFQQEALGRRYDILHKGHPIMTGVSLLDAENVLSNERGMEINLEYLECLSQPGEADIPTIRGLLLHTAVRFGLLSLVQFLFSLPNPSSGEHHLSIISPPKQEDLLITACRGGQLKMLEFLLSEGAELSFQMLGTPLHWLIMFPIDEARKALDLLLSTESGKACLLIEVPSPRVKMQHFHLSGTPLEWAITVNYRELMELLLAVDFDAKRENNLPALGWTDSTFRRAVASHLSDLIQILLPLELSYVESRPLFASGARFLLAHGEGKYLPFGLFDVSHSPNPPLFMALMHGSRSRAALDASIDAILQAGICALDDIDPKGLTALAHAVRYAPCTMNTDIISSFVSRGATFGKKKPAWIIANLVAKRRDWVEGQIMRLLLESGVLPLSIEMVTAAVRTGNARIVEAILPFVDSKGRRFNVNAPVVDNDDSASLLHIALLAPNHAEIMGLLLDYGADIEARWNNQTVLEATICAPGCDGEAINMLISRGASLALDGFTLIHRAASLKSQVDGLHILYHLLKHEKARAFVNFSANVSDGSTTIAARPLEIACLAGNVDAVRALLSAGAHTEPEGTSSSILDLAVSIGRRPQLSPRSDIDLNDEKMVYAWRLDMEEIVMMLLDKIAPGHGRTLLHVAVHLGNYKRIVELVECKGLEVTRVDRNDMRPADLLEDIALLENDPEESESYVENLKKISHYLLASFIGDVNLTSYSEERIKQMLEHMSTMTFESADEIAAKAEFDAALQEFKDAEDQRFVSSLGDGRDSPSELEARCSKLLAEQKQKQVLAHTDSRTLRIMEVLFRAYYMQSRYEEAEKIQYQVLTVREAQLGEDDPILHYTRSDRSRILCQLERYEEALAYTSGAVIKALDAFGIKHLASLALTCGLSIIEGSMGKFDRAIKLQEESLSIFENLEYEGWWLSQSASFGSIELISNLIFYRCKVEVLEGVSRMAEKAATAFEFVQTREFLQAFEFLSQAAVILRTNKRFEDAEVIYTKTVDICVKKHGKSKSYCTRTALERLSKFYLLRQKWKEAGVMLQQLLNILTAISDSDHPDKAKCMLDLAWALEKQERYVEASVLQEQAVRSLEQTLGLSDHQTLRGRLGLCRNYRNVNQLEKSEIMGRLAVDGFKSLSGEDDQWTLSAEDELAATLSAEDKSDEALELRQRRVGSMVRMHGEVHEKTQYALVLLSRTLMRMERFEEAVEQSQRALQICLKIWGQNSHLTSNCLYIQAKCKERSGDTGEAVKLFTRSIETERASHGGNNSETLTVMRHLGKLYLELEEYEKAEPLLRELLDEAPKIYGTEDQSEVQLATSHLGYICEMTDRQDEAIKHYQVAVRMARHMHGDSHAETIECLDDLVRVYIDSGRAKDAHMPAVEILQYKSKTLGKYHEETIDAHTALGIIYPELGMWPEAERMQRVVLRHLQSRSQDPGNPDNDDIIDAMATLAQSCKNQERYTEAEKHARHVLKYHVEQHGNEAEETLQSIIDLAYIIAESNQVAEAEQINREAYATCVRVFDCDHEQFIAVQSQYAYICYLQENLEEAEKTQLLLLDRDPDDVVELEFLQLVYTKMKRYDQAFDLCQKEISARQAVLGDEGLNDMQVLQAMTNMTNLYTAMERWSEAREHGERIRELVKKSRIEGLYQHDKTLLESMTALKPVYEALCEEDKLHDLVFQVWSKLFRS
jgi:tetratricopeptide (TPR) repeat protein/ankyrin repeat protein